MSFIQTYFLRVYAIERSKQGQDDRAAHHEALFQTRFLLFLPAVGLGSAAIVVVGRWSSSSLAILNEYRAFITLAAIAGLALTSFGEAYGTPTHLLVGDLPLEGSGHWTPTNFRAGHWWRCAWTHSISRA